MEQNNKSKKYWFAVLLLVPLLLSLLLLSQFFEPTYAVSENLPMAPNPSSGSMSGTITFFSTMSGADKIGVAIFVDPNGSPVDTGDWSGRSIEYGFSSMPDGNYYISAFYDADGSGGPPGAGETEVWYDADGNGQKDAVTISGGHVDDIDIALGNIIYVDDNATGNNDGSCWHDAYTSLQTALGAAVSGSEIWVAAGTYKPGASRTSTFQLKNGVGIYGGFDASEILRSDRNWQANVTTLSGDIGTVGTASDNVYHVVTGDSTDASARLDGFTVTEGYANVAGTHDSGGGLQVKNGSPTIANINFIKNYAVNHGSGMSIWFDGSTPLALNCTFSGNSTAWNGAVANLWSGHLTLVNSTIVGNSGQNGGGIVNLESGVATVRNSIIWDNQNNDIALYSGGTIGVEYSLVDGASIYPGTGNILGDPEFRDAQGPDNTYGTLDDDFRLLDTSPAIDAGDNSAIQADATDMNGNSDMAEPCPLDMDVLGRSVDANVADTGNGTKPIVDMGAYEFPIGLRAFIPMANSE